MKILLNNKFRIIILLIILILTLTTTVFASTKSTISDVFQDADDFVSGGGSSVETVDESKIQGLSGIVSGVLIGVGIIVAFAMMAMLGINFMINSVEKKAEVKEALTPYFIGLIVTFGAFAIWKAAIDLFSNM